MKINRKISILAIIAILLLISISVIVIKNNNDKEVELIQLSSQTNDRMMGYIIRTKEGKTIVIDGGMETDAENLKKYINTYGNKIDYWFITHPHRDHAGAFINMMENNEKIQIGKIYYSANSMEWYNKYASERAGEVEKFYEALYKENKNAIRTQPDIGDNIIADNIKIEILGINNPEITENPINNSSMVLKLYVNDKTILFLGDTGIESSEKLIEKYGENLKSDIVQMAHHGQEGATEELYELVNPNICLWPTPEWLWDNDSGEGYNSGNWTTLETRGWIDKLNVKTHYIAKDGDIKIKVK